MRRRLVVLLLVIMLPLWLLTLPTRAEEDVPTPTPDPTRVYALENELHSTQKEITETQKEKSTTESELQRVEEEKQQAEVSLQTLQEQLSTAQTNLTQVLVLLDKKTRELESVRQLIESRTQELKTKKTFFEKTLRELYPQLYLSDMALFLGASDFTEASQLMVYRRSVLTETKRLIDDLNNQITRLQGERESLEQVMARLVQERSVLDGQKQRFEIEVVSTQNQIAVLQDQQGQLIGALAALSSYLNSLTAKQQEILAQKAAAALASTTVGDFEIRRASIEKDPPRDGQLYFSFWTYGYPHRVGMNQYGAYGRAKAGQSAPEILGAYYSGIKIEDNIPLPQTIKISQAGGEREIDFEGDYLLGIGEMPSCWGDDEHGGYEALRAQAIAARSYAMAYTQMGAAAICADQRCQVYVGHSKVDGPCGDRWREAVESTRGTVIVYGGEIISAWYASTAGGFTLSSAEVWGKARPYAEGMADLDKNFLAYDGPTHGDSPWYHKAWGDEPWLSAAQLKDILNAALLPETHNQHLAPSDKGGFTPEQVVETLQGLGLKPIDDLTSLEVFGANSRAVTKLRAYHDGTYTELTPARFRFVFNLRSPGTDAIWTSRFDILTNQ